MADIKGNSIKVRQIIFCKKGIFGTDASTRDFYQIFRKKWKRFSIIKGRRKERVIGRQIDLHMCVCPLAHTRKWKAKRHCMSHSLWRQILQGGCDQNCSPLFIIGVPDLFKLLVLMPSSSSSLSPPSSFFIITGSGCVGQVNLSASASWKLVLQASSTTPNWLFFALP